MTHFTDPQRWEFGSIYHWPLCERHDGVSHPWDQRGVLFGSGRDAFRSLLAFGRDKRGWRRLWVPSYFCQGTVEVFASTGVEVCLYPCGPEDVTLGLDPAVVSPGDAVLRMNFLGLRHPLPLDGLDRTCVEVIDDHTHDPWSEWSWKSDADWCIASLRKVLPVPDGGVLWSPRGHEMPPQPRLTDQRRLASLEKLAAMALKGLYLAGHSFDREVYRRLAESGEAHLAGDEISGMPEWTRELLQCFPVEKWRSHRRQNHRILTAALAEVPGVRVLQPEDSARMCPYLGVIVFDSEARRGYVNDRLVERRVFLSVIWSLSDPAVEGIPPEHVQFSRRILCVASDIRYTAHDIERVADLVRECCREYRDRSDVQGGAKQASSRPDTSTPARRPV